MKRIKSIDIFRGFVIIIMIYVHTGEWWLISNTSDVTLTFGILIVYLFGPGFLFISGISTFILYRNGMNKVNTDKGYSRKQLRDRYFFRTLIIFTIAMTFNILVAISFLNPIMIWSWFMLLTIAFSQLITWPLLKLSKTKRIFIGIAIYITHIILFNLLLPFQGQINFFGLLFYFLYHSPQLNPILTYYIFFLIGTVIGEMIYDYNSIDGKVERRRVFKKKFMFPLLAIGGSLVLINLIIIHPTILIKGSFAGITFGIGINILLLTLLLIFEEYVFSQTKLKFKFFFYFSYYSLTIYITHNALYFVFSESLTLQFYWIAFFVCVIVIWLILMFVYNIWGEKASIKHYISKYSALWAEIFEEKRKLKTQVIEEPKN